MAEEVLPAATVEVEKQLRQQKKESDCRRIGTMFVNVILLLASVAGGALLVWWALAFHPDDEQLWMVPIGLVVFGTPIVVWLSVYSCGVCRKLRGNETSLSETTAVIAAGELQYDLER